ncbi:MAG: MFS transporter, partial [Gemmatimonadaceae bacterium]
MPVVHEPFANPPAPAPRRPEGARARTFQSLGVRNFRLFFIGQTISNTGNWLTTVALILLVLQLTRSGFAVGLLSACQFGPMFFFGAWAGAVADRVDKRRMLLWTQSLEMTQSIGLA